MVETRATSVPRRSPRCRVRAIAAGTAIPDTNVSDAPPHGGASLADVSRYADDVGEPGAGDLANAATLSATEPASPAPAAGSRSILPSGTLLAQRYRIQQLLGRGGMGVVYAARDTMVDRDVAIKLVAGRHADLERERLREELRATLELTHRNIARTYTLEDVEGETFIVMELVSGRTLAQRMTDGPVSHALAREIVIQILDALEVAHRRRIVHRDVKPSNIMLDDRDGRAILMDFGLARKDGAPGAEAGTANDAGLTTSIKGTPAYMAPEVVAGKRADERADLYAVGLILYELARGEPRTDAQIDTRHLPRDIARVVERATAEEREARFASADQMRAALAGCRARGRRWAWVAAIAATAVLAITGIAVFGGERGDHDRVRARALEKLQQPSATGSGSLRDQAEALFERGELAEAARMFRAAYAQKPEPTALFNAGNAYYRAKMFAQAREVYEQFLRESTSKSLRATVEQRLRDMPP
jgi:predicted Ser/Thr protein kinase